MDEDQGGWVDTCEFSRFMKLGRSEAAESARKKLQAANVATKKMVRATSDVLSGRDLAAKFAHVPPMTASEVSQMCDLFNLSLARERPDARHFVRAAI